MKPSKLHLFSKFVIEQFCEATKDHLRISHNAPVFEANIPVFQLSCQCAVKKKVKVPVYWPPIKVRYGICEGLLTLV